MTALRISIGGSIKTRWTHDLLDQRVLGLRALVVGRGCRDKDHLVEAFLALVESQRPVVERRRQPEAIFDQRLLARPVAAVHGPQLGHGDVALVDEHQVVFREIVEQRRRRVAGRSSGQMARVVFDAVAVPEFLDHLQVKVGPFLDPLGLDEPVFQTEERDPLLEFGDDGLDGALAGDFGGDVVAGRKDGRPLQPFDDQAAQRIDFGDLLDPVAEKIDAQGPILFVSGKQLDPVAPDAKDAAMKIVIVALILQGHEVPQKAVTADLQLLFQFDTHAQIVFRRSQAVYAGYTGHDDHITSRQDRTGGRMPQLVDHLVDG